MNVLLIYENWMLSVINKNWKLIRLYIKNIIHSIFTMNILCIDDLFVQICKHIDNVNNLLQLELLSIYHKNIIRRTTWYHIIVKLKSELMLQQMMSYHIFLNLDLSHTNVTDESVSKLINCHTLNLSCTKVTDESVSKLINCHTLNLYGTNVTDECITNLRKLNVICNK